MLGELPGGLTAKDYFAKQEKTRIFAVEITTKTDNISKEENRR